jgi:hypothetical protein
MIGRPPPPAALRVRSASEPAVPLQSGWSGTACKVVERALATLRPYKTQDKCRSPRDRGALEKAAEGLTTSSPDATPQQVLRLIPDAIRFTYCFQPENYTRGYYDIKERFESRGHEMYYSKNYWTDPEYKGINSRWVTAEGQRFEVQFHTPDSFHAKHQVTHLAYERIHDTTTTSRAERRELHAFQREVSSWIHAPDGAADIPDVKKEGF